MYAKSAEKGNNSYQKSVFLVFFFYNSTESMFNFFKVLIGIIILIKSIKINSSFKILFYDIQAEAELYQFLISLSKLSPSCQLTSLFLG